MNLNDYFELVVALALKERGILPGEDVELEDRIYFEAIKYHAAERVEEHLCRMPKMLKEARAEVEGFRKRNLKRWQPAFDLLETLWRMSLDAGNEFIIQYEGLAEKEKDFTFIALASLHSRVLLVASEAICLMKGGFPDGALSRWRTLHELVVVMQILLSEPKEISERYLDHAKAQSYKIAMQYQDHILEGSLRKIPDEDIAEMKELETMMVAKHGKLILKDYGWASPLVSKNEPNLYDLEKLVNLQHFRPYFKWASKHIHAAYYPSSVLLGSSELEENNGSVFVGPSNSGMVDPIQLTGRALLLSTSIFMNHISDAHTLVIQEMMEIIDDKLGPLAQVTEAQTLSAHKAKNNSN